MRAQAHKHKASSIALAADDVGQQLAQKLAKQTGCVVFVSYNLPSEDEYMRAFVQKDLLKTLPPLLKAGGEDSGEGSDKQEEQGGESEMKKSS